MVKVVFIRHGETKWNADGRSQGQSDVALSDTGRAQAALLADHFPVEKIDVIYSSDLVRAFDTALAVAGRFGLPVHREPAFREISFGDWEGLTYAQIVAKWPEAMDHFLQRPDLLDIPHGESFATVQCRAVKRLNELIQENEGKTVAVTAHGAVLRTLLAAALHMPLRYVWSIRQFNTAVNIVRYDSEAGATVELINSTAHLGGLR